jgi:zinc protease
MQREPARAASLASEAEFVGTCWTRYGEARVSRSRQADAPKAELSISATGDRVSISMLARRDTIGDAIALLAQLLREPVFPDTALDELKRQTLAAVEAQRDDPAAIVENALARRGDPYPRADVRHARSFDEQLDDAKAVTAEQVKSFHARFYGAGSAQFAGRD